ncbi:hypothetical protein B0I35DRAFT_274117 [Stachybotrys elegans]|uniref:Zn(2)-C6 fungal-type domain-containing protein n=1 Tax=Stachybotrys elegans TaxID=80388 RepID=A0A8K0SKY9_9HYPO|nr:hypothetical protein B0I35DRAFT_274117 [Stachybotrys elegans]
MPSRRAHKNSHHGCQRCKSKRVKCDQQQPRCQRCERHNADCIYRHLLTNWDPFQRPSNVPIQPRLLFDEQQQQQQQQGFPQLPPATDTPGTGTPTLPSQAYMASPTYVASSTTLNLDFPGWSQPERFYVHHFVNHLAVNNLAPILDSEIRPLLTQTIIDNIDVYPFVRHALVSFSALHLASERVGSSSQHLVTALHHKDTAIAGFRPFLSDQLQPQQCEAAVAASVVLVACTFAIPIADHAKTTGVDHLDLLSQVAGLFQGLIALLRLGRGSTPILEAMKTSNVRRSVAVTHRVEVAWPEAGSSIQRAITAIEALDESDAPALSRKTILHSGASLLHRLMQRVAVDEGSYVAVCMWLGRVDPSYGDMLRARDPLALVIMGHYAASRQGITAWWAKGWPQETLNAIAGVLQGQQQYLDLLDWCVTSVNLSPT